MVNEPYLHSADDGPIARNQSAIWLKCSKPSRWCQSRSFHYFIYIIPINFILSSFNIHHHVRLNAVITGYEPQPDLWFSLISWANIPCAIGASTCGKWIVGINHQKQFQRSFIESRFWIFWRAKVMFVNVNEKHKANFLHKSEGTLSSPKKTKGKKPRRDVQAKAKSQRDLQAQAPRLMGTSATDDKCTSNASNFVIKTRNQTCVQLPKNRDSESAVFHISRSVMTILSQMRCFTTLAQK